MPNKKIFLQLISQFREYISKLKELQKYSRKEFQEDWHIEYAIDRALQLAIECSIDLGKEIIIGSNFRKPSSYREVFVILQQYKIISARLSEQMQELARFRNRLVHEYLFLDPIEIYYAFQKNIKNLEKYFNNIKKFVIK